MKNWWIRFGCFLTGYNYHIVNSSSEVAAKAVKRYTAALLIVMILWAFVGYTFTQRYLEGSLMSSIFGACIAVVIIIQVERQIILSVHPTKKLFIARGMLAFMMALLGAVIIDQIILKQDIELEKPNYVSKRVNELLPDKTAELKTQIFALDSTVRAKELELQMLIEDVSKTPLIPNISTRTQVVPIAKVQTDSAGRTSTVIVREPSTTIVRSNSVNPKQLMLAPLDSTIRNLRAEKALKDNALLNIRPALEAEISAKTGFLDELNIMMGLISNSATSLRFLLLWFFFLLFIGELVLFC